MTSGICPYCRSPLTNEDAPVTVCEGCGTRHHSDCYAENGGCTIFGCSFAPADEPKMSVSTPELVSVGTTATPRVSESPVPAPAPPPPPPPPGGTSTLPPAMTIDELQRISNRIVPSMFLSFYLDDSLPVPEPEQDKVPNGPPKSRTTYILLGALLGAFGAHSFYAGYTRKACFQLAATVLTLGWGSPMSWIWAIIDICTIGQDSHGVQFES
jgi:TM2 domain-containing membrane protein YozV